MSEINDEFWNKWGILVKSLDKVVMPLAEQYKDLVKYLHDNKDDVKVASLIRPYMKEMDSLFVDIFKLQTEQKLEDTFDNIKSET